MRYFLSLFLLCSAVSGFGQSNLDDKAASSVNSPRIEQTFACLNCYSSNPPSGYHTGQDLVSSTGDSNIYAAGFGKVVTLQANGQGCNPGCNRSGCNCQDHGLGNAIVLEHTLLDGTMIYSLYAHNASFASGLAVGKCVAKGSVIATMGGTGYGLSNAWSTHSHLEFKTSGVLGAPDGTLYWGYTPDSPSPHGYRDPAGFVGNTPVWDGTAENYHTASNQVPYHPVGTLIRKRSDGTIYVIVGDNAIRGITSTSVLAGLYPNGGFGLESVLVVSDAEFALYQIGSAVNSQLLTNSRTRPDGTLIISPQGEISIVTSVSGTDGGRRPFPSASTFTGLGYSFCNAVQVSQAEYNSYLPVGPPVDGASTASSSSEITSLTAVPQQASWVYYQSNSTAQWYISNSSGVTYLLSGAAGYSGELVWGEIANGDSVATVNYVSKTVYVAPSASTRTSSASYPAITISGGRSVSVVSDRGYTAAQQVAGQTMSHAWYFFQVQSTGTWYIVNLSGTDTIVYRLRLKSDSSDYDWLLISNSSWRRSFSPTGSSMTITLSER